MELDTAYESAHSPRTILDELTLMTCSYDYLVVGSGFAGSVVAERLADAGRRVLVIDKRDHVGGSAFDAYDAHGVLIHPYGPHIFHTNAKEVIAYLSNFTDWRFYEHRGLGEIEGKTYPIPINRDTINQLYSKNFNEEELKEYLDGIKEPRDIIRTSEDYVLSRAGRDLYNTFFVNYFLKQWELHPSDMAPAVAAMFPIRTNTDDRYFDDIYQFMPADGYTPLFKAMLTHPNITISLATRYVPLEHEKLARQIVYTGPIDQYFDYRFGSLPYRSVRFEHEHIPDIKYFQSAGQVSFPNDHAYTRITEFKYLTGQKHSGTSILREYPTAQGEPYYPIPRPENEALYRRYAELARQTPHVTFVGRLAQYRYYHMDQVIAAALKTASRLIKEDLSQNASATG